MAITVVSEPTDLEGVYNCVQFQLQIDSPGIGNIQKSLGYQLEDGAGNPITGIEEAPYKGTPYQIDFRRDLQKHIYTTFPTPGLTALVPDSNIKKDYVLKYWEYDFDTLTCQKTQGTINTHNQKSVINSAFEYRRIKPFSGNFEILSDRPFINYTCKTKNDWLYIYSIVPLEIRAHAFEFTLGREKGPYSINIPANQVTIVPIGGANGFFLNDFNLDGVTYYNIEILEAATVVKDYQFKIKCCDEAIHSEIYWLEPVGGYASLQFQIVGGYGINRVTSQLNYSRSCTEMVLQTPKDSAILRQGLRTKADSFRKISLKTVIPWEEEAMYFLEGFFASSNHIIPFRAREGGETLARFNLDGGDYRFIEGENVVEIEASGTIGPKILVHEHE